MTRYHRFNWVGGCLALLCWVVPVHAWAIDGTHAAASAATDAAVDTAGCAPVAVQCTVPKATSATAPVLSKKRAQHAQRGQMHPRHSMAQRKLRHAVK